MKQDLPLSITLAGLYPIIVLPMLWDGTQDDLFYNLAWNRGQAGRSVVSLIILPTLLFLLMGITFATFFLHSTILGLELLCRRISIQNDG